MRDLAYIGMNDQSLLQSGIAFGSEPIDAPLWADGMNVEFQDGEVQQAKGYEIARPLAEKVLSFAQSHVGDENRAYFGTNKAVKYYNGTKVISIGSGYAAQNWELVPFGSWLLASDGVNPLLLWKNVDQLAEVTGATFDWTKILTKWGPYVIAMNTSNGGNWIEWCTDDDPETWEVLSTNSAGNFTCRDLDTDIVSCGKLGQTISIYTANKQQLMSYVGGDFVFSVVPGLEGIGAVSREAVLSVGGFDFGLSHDGLWTSDGTGFTYLDTMDMSKWLAKHVNFDAANTIKSGKFKNKILFALPIDGATTPNVTLSYNYVTKAFGMYDFVPSAFGEKSVFGYPLLGIGNALCFGEKGNLKGESPLNSFIQTKPLDCGDNNLFKRAQQVLLTLQGSATLSVGVQETLDSPIEWFHEADAATINNFLDREGLYLSLKISGKEDGTDWAFSGFKIRGEPTSYAV